MWANWSLRKPIGKGSWLQRSSEGKPCEPPSRNPKGFYSKLSRKTLMGSNTEAPGGILCFLFVDSEEAFPKMPQHTFFKNRKQQATSSYLTFFLMTVAIQLPWLWIKMTSVLTFASTSNMQKAILSKLHIYSERQLLRCTTRSAEEKAFLPSEQNCVHRLAKLQSFFVWLCPLYFKSRSPKPNSVNFPSSQPKPRYTRCSQTQKKTP